MKATNAALLNLAARAALQAGGILRSGFGTSYEISSKAGRQNLVTAYDKLCEETIIGAILKTFPDHAFVAEESGATRKGSSIVWIIDPLDGTVNFAHNIPVFSVSIAAAIDGDVVAGVIYQPMTQELFVAEKGQGAFLNGIRLQVSTTSHLDDSFLATGFPYNVDENPLHCIDRFSAFTRKGIPIRRLGSAAIDLAYVAAGRFDAYWEVTLQPWDVAAGKLIVEEAGGKVTRYDGKSFDILKPGPIVATNSVLHATMVKELFP